MKIKKKFKKSRVRLIKVNITNNLLVTNKKINQIKLKEKKKEKKVA